MKNRENEKYIKWGMTGAMVVAFGLLFCFLLFRSSGLAGFVGLFGNILRPFLFGAIIAYLVTPLAGTLERPFSKVMKSSSARTLANALAVVIALLIVAAVVMLIVPQLINSIVGIVKTAPAQFDALMDKAQKLFSDFVETHPEYAEQAGGILDDASTAAEKYFTTHFGSAEDIMKTITPILTGTANSVSGVFGTLKDLLIGVIVSLYLLSKRAQLAAQASMIVHAVFKPVAAVWIENEARFADKMFNGFFMGKLLDSAIVGVLCFLGCIAMGFGSPLLIAVIVGVTNIIPFFGPFIGAIPSALLLLLENPMHCLMFLGFVIILQQLDGNVIGPKILGDSTGLSALWVMFGILLFGGLWGIPGMLVGVPLMAVIYDVVRQLTFRGIREQGQADMIESYNAQFHPPVEAKKKKRK